MLRFLGWLTGHSARPNATLWVIGFAAFLASPSLMTPLVADDLMHQVKIDPERPLPGLGGPDAPYFVFADGTAAQRSAMMEEGMFSWWTAEDFKLAFWRPVSEATHRLDDVLFGPNSLLIHLHSLIWFILVLWALNRLYRRLHTPRAAFLALCLYGFDDARGLVLGFASNRNALVAVFFSACVLIAHDRWRREGWRWGTIVGPMMLGVALLSGEIAIAATAYLFAYALFIDEEPFRRRVLSLLPYAALTLAWLVVHRYQGYGAMNSGIYIHPLADPFGFLHKLTERLPMLVLGQVGGVPSDLWIFYPPNIKEGVLTLAYLFLLTIAWLLVPWMRRNRVVSFWTLGAALSLLPVCATFANDRLLGMVAIGASGTLAIILADALSRPPSKLLRTGVGVLVMVHLILAPMTLPLRAMTIQGLDTLYETTVNQAVPRTPEVTQQTLVVPQALSDGSICYLPATRAARKEPRPKALRLLSSGYQRVEVLRLDAHTLKLEPEQGFYATEGEQMTRSASQPFAVGDRVALGDMRVTVTEVNDRGRAMSAEFRFDSPLEDPKWLWMQFNRGVLEPWAPPSIGARATLAPLL
ncbi:MAG: glycosyltransferase family 39 protein [Myxococcota bacterium]